MWRRIMFGRQWSRIWLSQDKIKKINLSCMKFYCFTIFHLYISNLRAVLLCFLWFSCNLRFYILAVCRQSNFVFVVSTRIYNCTCFSFKFDHGYEETSMCEQPNAFCHIYGYFTLICQRRNITLFVRYAYKAYFGLNLGDQDKKWVPHSVYHNFKEMLRDWTKRNIRAFLLGFLWPGKNRWTTQLTAIFCLINTKGVGKKNTQSRILVSS